MASEAGAKSGAFPPRTLMSFVMAVAGLGLIYALFRTFGATGADFMEALSRSPWQLYLAVTIILVLNNLVGAVKWRTAIRWVDPAAPLPPMMASFEASIFGSLFGLLLLPQVTSAAARWVVLRRNGVRGSLAVSTTFYEQVCDLFMLTTAGIAGLVILLFTLGPVAGGLLAAAAFATALVAMGPIFASGAVLFASIGRFVPRGRIAGALGTFAEVLRRLAAAPWRASLMMMSYSALRLVLQVAHGLAIAFVFAPTAVPMLVAAGVPAGVLAATIPISPSGLGIADWTWGGMLVLAGAAPIAAAIATLASRIAYMISLSAVGGALCFFRLTRRVFVNL
ncbi:MAG: lysylphosphatidylglycerol synthase domain-containing protein [Dongiaceae bacterium]